MVATPLSGASGRPTARTAQRGHARKQAHPCERWGIPGIRTGPPHSLAEVADGVPGGGRTWVAQLITVFEVYDDEDEAVKSFA
ncbi:hypothetical protein DBP19_07905 [Streptomyces sp. CS090A]|nr:hypothetical protein DBP19_07905 [Streptomyces sp. CS090A]